MQVVQHRSTDRGVMVDVVLLMLALLVSVSVSVSGWGVTGVTGAKFA